MRTVTTIFCSIIFLAAGVMMALSNMGSPGNNSYKTINAAPAPRIELPKFPNPGVANLSDDLLRDLAKQKGLLDTVTITKTDTIEKQVTKIKWKKVPAPQPVMEINVVAKHDTVPIYYLATQVGTKEGPTGKCVSVYEVHKVNEICSDTINSSTICTPQYNNDTGE